MTTREFHQIASCASMIAELAKEGEEMANAINSERESIDFCKAHGLPTDFPESESVKYTIAKSKIEERLKAKNEELQKIILINEMFQ